MLKFNLLNCLKTEATKTIIPGLSGIKALLSAFIVLTLFTNNAFAQPGSKKISGYLISEKNIPLIGVKIKMKEDQNFLLTDSTGAFQLFYEPGEIRDSILELDVKYSDFKYSRLNFVPGKKILIKVEEDPVLMDYRSEIQFSGYSEIPVNNVYTIPVKAITDQVVPKQVVPNLSELKRFVVRTFFATDRGQNPINESGPSFNGKRSNELKYGYCDVNIPNDHEVGEIEAPKWWKLEFRPNPEKHVMILSTRLVARQEFSKLSNAAMDTSGKNAFVFIHGYNVTFDEAAKRTAQIAYDLKFKGIPVFYSWPSLGKVTSYKMDEGNIEWTQIHLENFLTGFLGSTKAEKVFIIAHSLGNRAMTRVLSTVLEKNPQFKAKVKEVILAAPDIDAEVFKTQIAPPLIKKKLNITLYASSKDIALQVSQTLASYPRAGQSGNGLVVLDGIETIDVSKLNTDIMGHSYFAATRTVFTDLAYLINSNLRASGRQGLKKINLNNHHYWLFEK